jgi:putative DNA primase/helicase
LPETLTARTGGGGLHYYFKMPADLIGCRTKLGGWSGVDLKGEGGYVVAPPSGHPSGGCYEWVSGSAADVPVAEVPAWIVDLASSDPRGKSAAEREPINLRADEGTRNPSVFNLARKLRDGGLTEEAAVEVVLQANENFSPPLEETEVRRTVTSVFKRDAFDAFPINDMGNARRLVKLAAGNVRHEPTRDRFLIWSGGVFVDDEDGEVMRLAREVTRQIEDDAWSIDDPEIRGKALAAARKQQSHARLKAMVELFKTEPEIPVHAQRLDTHPYLLNVRNGVVDLKTGELKPHDRSLLLTKMVPVEFDSAADCPRFERFLDEAFLGDADLIACLQRLLGYALTGDAREQVFFMFVGMGANGKSTLLNVISFVAGPYASHTPSDTLIAQKNGRTATNDIARLNGARLITASEFNPGEKLATGLIKQLTGNEKVTARFLFQEFRDFHFTGKIVLATNDIPQMDGADDALFRRVVVIPFDRVFAKHQQDPLLFEKLKDEAPGILAWLVWGAVEWYRAGLQLPPRLLELRDSIRREMDPVAQFLDEACIVGGSFETQSAVLHSAFSSWAHRHGVPPIDSSSFGRAIAKRGHRSRKSNGRKLVRGVQLRPEVKMTMSLLGEAA